MTGRDVVHDSEIALSSSELIVLHQQAGHEGAIFATAQKAHFQDVLNCEIMIWSYSETCG